MQRQETWDSSGRTDLTGGSDVTEIWTIIELLLHYIIITYTLVLRMREIISLSPRPSLANMECQQGEEKRDHNLLANEKRCLLTACGSLIIGK